MLSQAEVDALYAEIRSIVAKIGTPEDIWIDNSFQVEAVEVWEKLDAALREGSPAPTDWRGQRNRYLYTLVWRHYKGSDTCIDAEEQVWALGWAHLGLIVKRRTKERIQAGEPGRVVFVRAHPPWEG